MSNNIVFIIGAGASTEVNLKTGVELKRRITHLLDIKFDMWGEKLVSGDRLITNALFEQVLSSGGKRSDINPYLHEARHISDAMPQAISIDNFIDSQRGNEKIAFCGKLAIVRSILEDEKVSLLYFDPDNRDSHINFDNLEKTWYTPFFQLLTENCTINDIKERIPSITLVIFNYDRCIEHFLYNAFKNLYRVTDQQAIELTKSIKIYHPYGTSGTLPWFEQSGAIAFGAEPTPKQLLSLTTKIKTFTEGADPQSIEITEIRNLVKAANKAVFLGFAFHKLNMQLISPPAVGIIPSTSVECFATTFGISDNDMNVIRNQINNLFMGRTVDIYTANKICTDFFKEFWRSLSF